MTTPETPQPTPEPNAAEATHETPAAPAPPAAPATASSDDDGPEPGNEAAPDHEGDGDEEDGPAPGNERVPGGLGGPAAPGGTAAAPGTGKKRRRRRKKKPGAGQGAQATGEGAAAPGEGAATAQGGEGGEAGATSADAGSADGAKPGEGGEAGRGKKKKRDRGPRPPHESREPRERPAFNVGELVFGKILDINEDAFLIDLSGKGLALFDRTELDIVDEPATPAEARAHAEAEAAEAAHDEAAAEASTAEATATPAVAPPVELQAEVAVLRPEPPAEQVVAATADEHGTPSTPAQAGLVTAEAKEALGAVVGAVADAVAEVVTATTGEAPAEAEAKPEGEGEKAQAEPTPRVEQHAPLPPIVLEAGASFVGYIHNDGGRGGLVVVTRHPKRASKIKPVVAQAAKDKTTVKGLVTGVIKGGVEVDVQGLRAFAPGSHMDLRPGADLTPLLGRRLEFYVTQYGKRGRDVVLSRKAFLEVEAKAAREAALAKLKPNSVVDGTVRSVVPFGAFIDVGGIEGLVPLAEMSHNRSEGPNDVFKVGDAVSVKILKIDERGKVWLSRKATIPDPWVEAAKKYSVGTRHTGKVVRLQPFGAFVELEAGIDGLVHVADLSPKRIEHPQEVVKVGDEIEVVVASTDPHAHKIALHPAPTGEAANEAPQRVALHRAVKVVVTAVETGGLNVRILGATGRHARGFITAAATGTPRGTELRKVFPVGKELEAKVIEMDPRRSEVKLSVKALNEESERTAYRQYREQVAQGARFTFADLIATKRAPQK